MSFNPYNQEFYSQELSDTSQEIEVCWQAISRQETKLKDQQELLTSLIAEVAQLKKKLDELSTVQVSTCNHDTSSIEQVVAAALNKRNDTSIRKIKKPGSRYKNYPSKMSVCSWCHGPFHSANNCRRRLGLCYRCGSSNHFVSNCHYPARSSNKKNNSGFTKRSKNFNRNKKISTRKVGDEKLFTPFKEGNDYVSLLDDKLEWDDTGMENCAQILARTVQPRLTWPNPEDFNSEIGDSFQLFDDKQNVDIDTPILATSTFRLDSKVENFENFSQLTEPQTDDTLPSVKSHEAIADKEKQFMSVSESNYKTQKLSTSKETSLNLDKPDFNITALSSPIPSNIREARIGMVGKIAEPDQIYITVNDSEFKTILKSDKNLKSLEENICLLEDCTAKAKYVCSTCFIQCNRLSLFCSRECWDRSPVWHQISHKENKIPCKYCKKGACLVCETDRLSRKVELMRFPFTQI